MITIKTPEEIENIRQACKIVANVLMDLKEKVRPGITTKELNEIGERLLLLSGAIPAFKGYRGYKYATCLSVNSEVVHGLPGDKVLLPGDIISIDVGAVYNGYYGDVAATFPVGKISEVAQKLITVAREALYLSIREAREGNHLGDISSTIESCAKKAGFSVVKDLFGHGIGRALHEDPLIPNFGKKGEGSSLLSGMVLAIEPMVNAGGSEVKTLEDGWTVVTADNSLSAHFEHTVAVTSHEPEILTSW